MKLSAASNNHHFNRRNHPFTTYIDVRYVHGGSFFSGISCSQIFHVSHVFVSCLLFFFTHACIYQRPFKYAYFIMWDCPISWIKSRAGPATTHRPLNNNFQPSILKEFSIAEVAAIDAHLFLHRRTAVVRWDCYEILVKLRRGFPYQGAVS